MKMAVTKMRTGTWGLGIDDAGTRGHGDSVMWGHGDRTASSPGQFLLSELKQKAWKQE